MPCLPWSSAYIQTQSLTLLGYIGYFWQGSGKEELPYLFNHVQQGLVTVLKPGFPCGCVLLQPLHFLGCLQKWECLSVNPKALRKPLVPHGTTGAVPLLPAAEANKCSVSTMKIEEEEWFISKSSRSVMNKLVCTGAKPGRMKLLRSTLCCCWFFFHLKLKIKKKSLLRLIN